MSFSSSRRVGRPSSTVLSASKIARQARRLLARDGNFTMGALARELRVAPSSLYNHFQSRDEVLGAVSDAVVSEIRVDSLREAVVVIAEQDQKRDKAHSRPKRIPKETPPTPQPHSAPAPAGTQTPPAPPTPAHTSAKSAEPTPPESTPKPPPTPRSH